MLGTNAEESSYSMTFCMNNLSKSLTSFAWSTFLPQKLFSPGFFDSADKVNIRSATGMSNRLNLHIFREQTESGTILSHVIGASRKFSVLNHDLSVFKQTVSEPVQTSPSLQFPFHSTRYLKHQVRGCYVISICTLKRPSLLKSHFYVPQSF